MYSKILRALSPLTAVMLLVSAGWTAANVLTLIGTSNPLSYATAAFLDLGWLVATAVQHETRFRVDLRGRLSAITWSLTGLSSALNAVSELLGHHGVAAAVVSALVPLIAKSCLNLKLFVELNSAEARTRFASLTQSAADQLTELKIQESLAAQWFKIERLHENRDAQRLAVTQQDRFANLELAAGTSVPVPVAVPITWTPPTSNTIRSTAAGLDDRTVRAAVLAARATMPDADASDLVRQLGRLGVQVGVDTVRAVLAEADQAADVTVVRGEASGDMPQVGELSKADQITAAARLLGADASPADIAHHLASQGVGVDTAYVRTVLARARKRAEDAAENDPPFGFR